MTLRFNIFRKRSSVESNSDAIEIGEVVIPGNFNAPKVSLVSSTFKPEKMWNGWQTRDLENDAATTSTSEDTDGQTSIKTQTS